MSPQGPTSSRRSSRSRYGEFRAGASPRASSEPVSADGKAHSRGRSFGALAAAFWGMLRGHRVELAASLGSLTLATLIGLALPASTKIAFDYVILDTPGPAGLPDWVPARDDRVVLLWLLGGSMVALAGLSVSVGLWGRWRTTRLTKVLQAGLRRRAFAHAARLPLHRVHALKSGGVASLLRDDAGAAADLLFSLIYNPWRAVIQLIGTLAVLATVDWRMLLGGLAVIPATWLTHRTWINRIRPVYRAIKATRQATDAHATEAFAGVRVVRGFAREHAESLRFGLANHLMARQEMLAWWRSRVLELVWALLIPLASTAVLVYGGSRVIDGALTVGDVMMFTAYVLMLLGPMETLTSTATSVQTNLAGFDRVLDLLAEPREFEGTPWSRRVARETARGRIEIEHAWFAYPNADPRGATPQAPPVYVLEDISLTIEPGTTVALVGASGSGKTTLSNLVARFHDPTRGRVLFDGVDLREIDPASYRSLLGIVEQDVFLFDGTIAQNIAYGRRGVTEAMIRRAAGDANADEFIRGFKDGYATMIGERGVRLSGGQKQRLAIARALLADPVVLILDEATSNLDAVSESLIQRSLASLMRGRTCVVIAHRLSTIRHADLIVVLDHGRVVQRGRHDELLASGGPYAALLRAQVEPSEPGPTPEG
ncbi:MAG: ABC transporter ATP-binding protein [Phycisphaeraceae bacterium]|nr:MAG: ABC transporter ATP-binding protein [Phycisphaeraceae bacterium]